MQPFRRRRAVPGDLADHPAQTFVPQAFLHGEQHVRVASRFDIDDPVGVQSREMKRRREQVAPAQAPQDRTIDARKDAGEEDRRAGIVGEIGAAGYFMQCAARDAAGG